MHIVSEQPVLVLVHGAYQRPSVWDESRTVFTGLGYETRAPALPSSGSSPTASMYDDAAVIREEVEKVGGPVVVVAHSYSGIPVTEALTGAADVSRLIFVAAHMLDKGQSMYSRMNVEPPEDTTGTYPTPSREELFHDVPDEVAAKATAELVQQALLPFTNEVTRAAWQAIPSTYVICEDDRCFPVPVQESMALQATEIRRWPGGHCPYLADPKNFALLIDDIVRGAAENGEPAVRTSTNHSKVPDAGSQSVIR
ncbi:alpha/beta hydrolase [Streptomyces sp. NPDC003393]